MLITVGSKNPAKLKAVQIAVDEVILKVGWDLLINASATPNTLKSLVVEGVDVHSGVSDQPMSDEESIKGAITRAKAAFDTNKNSSFGIGLEGGIQQVGDRYFESGWIAVYNGVHIISYSFIRLILG
jgi:non-canonical (house-cleaning) NTP pyrophosphatase